MIRNFRVFWPFKGPIVFLLSMWAYSLAQANMLGANVQSFTPNPNGKDFVVVRSSRVLGDGVWSYSFYSDYSKNNLLIYATPIADQKKLAREDHLLGGFASLSRGLSPNLELSIQVPMVLDQDVNKEQYKKVYISNGPVEMRGDLKYSFSENKNEGGFAAVVSLELPNVKNDPYLGNAPQPIVNVELIFDDKNETSGFAGNLGYRSRNPGKVSATAPMFPIDDQMIYSLAYGANFSDSNRFRWVTEFVGSYPLSATPYKNAVDISTGEVLVSLKSKMKRDFFWNVGAGAEVFKGSLSPDYRVFTGIQFDIGDQPEYKEVLIDSKIDSGIQSDESMKPFIEDTDGDGVADKNDDCPDTTEGLAVDHHGCPADLDNDGVIDIQDKCPKTPAGEVVDQKGCSVMADSDFDGVPNIKDKCPRTEAGVKIDKYGCAVKKKKGNKK